MSGLQAWVGGALVPLEQARVSVLDQGFRTGEGVFETLRAYGQEPFRLGQHLARARHGTDRLGFAPPADAVIEAAVRAVVAANAAVHAGRDSVLRLTLTPGALDPDSAWPGEPTGEPTLVVTSHLLGEVPPDVTAITVSLAREQPDVKAVSHLIASLARRRAAAAGAGEAILTTADGHVLEGSGSNVFAVVDGELVTPGVDAGLLPGVTRAVVLEVAAELGIAAREAPLLVAALAESEEAFITSSTREIVPLVRVDGRAVGSGAPGAMTARLQDGFRALVRRETATP